MLSEDGRRRISNSSKKRQYFERNKLGTKILEVYLDDFGHYVYNNPNEYIETRKVNWTKIKRALYRNKSYIDRGTAPKHLKETTPGAWSCVIDINTDIIFVTELIKNRLLELKEAKHKKRMRDLNCQFESLFEQWSQIMKTSKKFPITTAEVLDEFYSKNPEFLIAKTKTEKRRLYFDKHAL